jgi:hypothetical protein
MTIRLFGADIISPSNRAGRAGCSRFPPNRSMPHTLASAAHGFARSPHERHV